MVYKVVTAAINNDGSVTEGKRKMMLSWPGELKVGGLYFLVGGRVGRQRLYRVVEAVQPGT